MPYIIGRIDVSTTRASPASLRLIGLDKTTFSQLWDIKCIQFTNGHTRELIDDRLKFGLAYAESFTDRIDKRRCKVLQLREYRTAHIARTHSLLEAEVHQRNDAVCVLGSLS